MVSYDIIYETKKDVVELKEKYGIKAITPTGPKQSLNLQKNEFPVWVLWEQGFDNAPDVVQTCIKSIKKNLPLNAKLFLLDETTLNEYITLPEYISKIGTNYTHLSNIVRAALLYLYGGMWLDATYFVLNPIPQDIFEKDFWAIKEDLLSETGLEIPEGFKSFTWNVMYCKESKNPLILTVYRILCNYWLNYDILKHYLLKDGAILYGYENNYYPKELITNLEYSNPNLYTFLSRLNKEYNKEEFEKITKDTTFFKLTYKIPIEPSPNLTYYKYLKSLV